MSGNLKDVNSKLYREFSEENYDLKKGIKISRNSIITDDNRNYYWWNCGYGHTWNARLDKRLKGAGCVYCMHDEKRRR